MRLFWFYFSNQSSLWKIFSALLLIACLAAAAALPLAAAEGGEIADRPAAITPFTDLGKKALTAFSGINLWMHLSAVGGTFLIVQSGLDTEVHNFFSRNTFFEPLSWPGVVGGAILPVVLGGVLWLSGKSTDSTEVVAAGSCVLQVSLVAVCYTTTLKALTGRSHPDPGVIDAGRAGASFRFGLLRGGVFWGWPSGHMLANTAAVTSLLSFYKGKTWLQVAGWGYLGYLFLSIAAHNKNSMHWFSDEVAGTLMGYAIGSTVGRSFRRRWEGKKEKETAWNFTVAPGLLAVSLNVNI